jgi:hypothetical protein
MTNPPAIEMSNNDHYGPHSLRLDSETLEPENSIRQAACFTMTQTVQIWLQRLAREHLLGRQVLSPWPQLLDGSYVSINSIQYSCFASAFAPSKPSILCFAFLMFLTISGNLLLARSKPRRLN